MGHVADSPDVTQQVNRRDCVWPPRTNDAALGEAGSSAEPPVEVASSSIAVACVGTHCARARDADEIHVPGSGCATSPGRRRSRPEDGPRLSWPNQPSAFGSSYASEVDQPDDRWTSRAALGANGREPGDRRRRRCRGDRERSQRLANAIDPAFGGASPSQRSVGTFGRGARVDAQGGRSRPVLSRNGNRRGTCDREGALHERAPAVSCRSPARARAAEVRRRRRLAPFEAEGGRRSRR